MRLKRTIESELSSVISSIIFKSLVSQEWAGRGRRWRGGRRSLRRGSEGICSKQGARPPHCDVFAFPNCPGPFASGSVQQEMSEIPGATARHKDSFSAGLRLRSAVSPLSPGHGEGSRATPDPFGFFPTQFSTCMCRLPLAQRTNKLYMTKGSAGPGGDFPGIAPEATCSPHPAGRGWDPGGKACESGLENLGFNTHSARGRLIIPVPAVQRSPPLQSVLLAASHTALILTASGFW